VVAASRIIRVREGPCGPDPGIPASGRPSAVLSLSWKFPMPEALIIDACRTPRGIGKVGKGALDDMHPQHLATTVLKALAERNNLKTAEVDDVIWGCSSQRGVQSNDMARMALLDAGYDTRASGVTLDRFCGSGITSVNLAASSIMSGMEDLMIAGG